MLSDEAGRRIVGDVELHVSAPDWYGHRHHLDAAYNGVVLHVVLWPSRAATSRQESGIEAPIATMVTVPSSTDEPVPEILSGLDRSDDDSVGDLLDRAGEDRFMARSRAFRAELANESADQVLYRSLMETLGYASNRKPFRQLATVVPVSALFGLKNEPGHTRLLASRAMLLSGAGLLARVGDQSERRERLLSRLLPGPRPMPESAWRMFRVRPANHPLRRIEGATHLLDRYTNTGLASGLEKDVLREDPGHLASRLAVPPLIGSGRASDMAVNVVLPFMHAYGALRGSEATVAASARLYREYPRLADNEIIREMRRLLGAPAVVTNALRQQGLLHLYRRMRARSVRERPRPAIATG